MFNPSKIIILSLIALISVATPADSDSKIVPPSWLSQEDIESLRPLEPKQALPIVFIENDLNVTDRIQFPTNLAQVGINDGRLISGTEFMQFSSNKKQMLLCRDPNNRQNCLVPKKFGESEILQCEDEPIPLIFMEFKEIKKCGPGGIGISYARIYKICEAKRPYTFRSRSFQTYTFCYDESSNRILFVVYRTISAGLHLEKALERERQIEFHELIADTNGKINEDYRTILDTEAKLKPKYRFQKLLWPEYMPFAMWKKTTYHYVNVALQHRALFDLWNEINGYIKTDSIKSYNLPRVIITGTTDIPDYKTPTEKDSDQIYNVWYTAIMSKHENPVKGIIIMMNNFITEKTNDGHYLDEICPENLCVGDLNQRFAKIGGQVRCCKITLLVSKLFYTDEKATQIDKILNIQDVTFQKSK